MLNERDRDKHGIIDLTSVPQQQQQSAEGRRALRGTVSSNQNQNQNNKPTIFIIQEDKGGFGYSPDSNSKDEYSKYNDLFDPNDDERLINSGATIISSTLELTDSSGMNRTIVRKQI
jgi:hypothetical protein